MLEVRESQIEDILASQLDEARDLLSVQQNLSLVARQKTLPSGGILDLLYLSPSNLLLVELKVVPSQVCFCHQVAGYRDEVIDLQTTREMPNVPVKGYLACPAFSDRDKKLCRDLDITPVLFSPYRLLENYYSRVKAITVLIQMKPSNHGLWNLSLLNRLLYAIDSGTTVDQLRSRTSLAKSTIGSYLRLSTELGLTTTKPVVALTPLGRQYVEYRETDKPEGYISDKQSEVVRTFIVKNPFHSPAVFGIYSAVETVFALSKNYYPVPLKEAVCYFSYLSGKQSEWGAKAGRDAFIMYSNYGIELGLLAKMGRTYYITPLGIRFILLLELNKSILFATCL
ncbi:MAG: hypothetical protein ABIF82_11935 [Planctomycetota bacterium]